MLLAACIILVSLVVISIIVYLSPHGTEDSDGFHYINREQEENTREAEQQLD